MIFVSLFLVLFATLIPFLNHLRQFSDFFAIVDKFQTSKCRKIHRNFIFKITKDPLLHGCENGQLLSETNQVFLACAIDINERLKWWPAADHWNSSPNAKGGIVIFDLKTTSVSRLKLEGFESDFFSPHGMGIVRNPNNSSLLIIMAVNHRLDRSTIEIFEHVIGTFVAVHIETVKDNNIYAPNDVVPIDKTRFYATNDCSYRRGFLMRVERYLAQPWSNVIYRDENKNIQIVAKNIIYANGIATNSDASLVYVVSTLGSFLHVYERRNTTGTLRMIDQVKLPMMGDNPSFDFETGEIYVTGHKYLPQWLQHSGNISLYSPSVVVKLSPVSGKEIFYGKKFNAKTIFEDDGSLVSGGSIAIVDHKIKRSLIGSVYDDGVVYCEKVL